MSSITKSFLLITAVLLGVTLFFLPAPRQADAADLPPIPEGHLAATFAGGCFWCMEPPFDKIDGVKSTTSGYIGGPEKNPTYKQVAGGRTGHTEAVQIVYDPEKVTDAELLEIFWRNIDPTVEDRQFCDWGSQYRTGIFYHDDEQKSLAEASKRHLLEATQIRPIVTEITFADTFYPAEEYHQDFYLKNPGHYKRYRRGCGRDARLQEIWGATPPFSFTAPATDG